MTPDMILSWKRAQRRTVARNHHECIGRVAAGHRQWETPVQYEKKNCTRDQSECNFTVGAVYDRARFHQHGPCGRPIRGRATRTPNLQFGIRGSSSTAPNSAHQHGACAVIDRAYSSSHHLASTTVIVSLPPYRPKIFGRYISSAYNGGTTNSPGVTTRAR